MALVEDGLPTGATLERFRVMDAGDLDDPELQVLDVREQDEQDEIVPGAVCVPYRDLVDADLGTLDPERPVATVCNSGVRAAVAATLLARRGFRDVRPVLQGGMGAYLASARPAAR
jgi:rhodanese-related sulfurtransferase